MWRRHQVDSAYGCAEVPKYDKSLVSAIFDCGGSPAEQLCQTCRAGCRLDTKARLMHQRQHGFAEELKIGCEIEKGDLDAVATGALKVNQLADHTLRTADDLNVAA